MRVMRWSNARDSMRAEVRFTRHGLQVVAINWNPRDKWHDAEKLNCPWPWSGKIWCDHCGHRWSLHRPEHGGCKLDPCVMAPPKWLREHRPKEAA